MWGTYVDDRPNWFLNCVQILKPQPRIGLCAGVQCRTMSNKEIRNRQLDNIVKWDERRYDVIRVSFGTRGLQQHPMSRMFLRRVACIMWDNTAWTFTSSQWGWFLTPPPYITETHHCFRLESDSAVYLIQQPAAFPDVCVRVHNYYVRICIHRPTCIRVYIAYITVVDLKMSFNRWRRQQAIPRSNWRRMMGYTAYGWLLSLEASIDWSHYFNTSIIGSKQNRTD